MNNNNKRYLLPIILVTSLFFLWGFAYGLLDVLNKHFQVTLNITRQRSMLLQAAYFGAYFLVALPAGLFMQKAGYKKGIITGLLLYATSIGKSRRFCAWKSIRSIASKYRSAFG